MNIHSVIQIKYNYTKYHKIFRDQFLQIVQMKQIR